MAKQGVLTGEFGEWLSTLTKDSTSYSVYYDHGDKDAHRNVVATKGFVGEFVRNFNRLADIDILIVNKDNRIEMIIEIEERASNPKKILGDVFSILLCDRFAVRQDGKQMYYGVHNGTKLIIAGVVPDKGNRLRKINEVISPRIKKFNSPFNGIKPENVDLIFSGNIRETIDALKKTVRKSIGV
jgi:hypothetical protein